MHCMKTWVAPFVVTAVLALGLAGAVTATEAPTTRPAPGRMNHQNGLAIQGYDPVAYFRLGKPVLGSRKYRAKHDGTTFRFASAAHRDSFAANPERWAPLYGGFCAYGTAKGYKADINPAAFTIVDGRLYLNYNDEVKAMWSKDVPGYIEQANQNWPEVAKTDRAYR